MERLNQVIEEAIIANKWKPIQASRNSLKLSNLCFADDIILFAEATVDQAEVLQQCLHHFCTRIEDNRCQLSGIFFPQ